MKRFGNATVAGYLSLLAGVMALPSCKGQPLAPAPDAGAPTYQQLVESHNQRVKQLQKVYAQGVIEIRWSDQHGNHFEQGDMELWLQQPRKTALRVEKLGEVLLWLGSDEKRYWLFDMTGKESVLYAGDHAAPLDEEQGVFSVKPLALLDLMALTELPEHPQIAAPVEYDKANDAWMISAQGQGGPMRMFFDCVTSQPKRVESLSLEGNTLLFSTLRRYEGVTQEGKLPVAYPRMARLIDISSVASPANPDAARSGQVKIAINQATGDVEAAQLERVFDLDRLIKGLRPQRIDGDVTPAGAVTGQMP